MTFDLSRFSHDNLGHADNCPMLTAYDNDGCDCADLLLYEVERLQEQLVALLFRREDTAPHHTLDYD